MSGQNGTPVPPPGGSVTYQGGLSAETRAALAKRSAMFLSITQGTGKPMVYGTGDPAKTGAKAKGKSTKRPDRR